MAQLPRALAEQVGGARVAGGSSFISHGSYVFLIKRWFFQKVQDEVIIVELIPVESRKITVYQGDKKVEMEPNAPGSECSEVANFDGAGKLSAPANARAVVLGLFGFKENDIPNQKVVDTQIYVTSDEQPAAGMLIACSTFSKEIRSKKGEYITGRNWSCVAVPGTGVNAPDMVAARLAAYKQSPEMLVKVAMEQLTIARASGAAPALPVPESEAQPASPGNGQSAPALATAATAPVVPVMPAIPSLPGMPAIPAPAVDPLAGWTKHPQSPPGGPVYYFKDEVVKAETDIRAGK